MVSIGHAKSVLVGSPIYSSIEATSNFLRIHHFLIMAFSVFTHPSLRAQRCYS